MTFGNIAELVLAFFVLLTGQQSVVKAQITGSIIGNGLLGFGLAIAVGTWGGREMKFKLGARRPCSEPALPRRHRNPDPRPF